jgi:AcrR family transcriptional regulator
VARAEDAPRTSSARGLLRDKGATAVTTRAAAQAAGLQAPTIYRFFEDKDALLDAVAELVLTLLSKLPMLTDTERALLSVWLDRAAIAGAE